MTDLLEWKDAPRDGFKSNGEKVTQIELAREKQRVKVVLRELVT